MSAPFRTLLPKREADPAAPVTALDLLEPRRIRNTPTACDACRRRKSKCDGQQPQCASCTRRGLTCVYTNRRQADEKALSAAQEGSIETLRVLQTLPRDQAFDLLETLRAAHNVDEDADSPALPGQLSEQQLLRTLLSPTQESLEFELMIRFPIAYPALVPVSPTSLPLERLLRPRRIARARPNSSPRNTDLYLLASAYAKSGPSSVSQPMSIASSQQTSPTRSPFPQRRLVDYRLSRIDIGQWTGIPITSELAAHVISLYLEIDYPVLPLFNADAFLGDLIGGENNFCSGFLVSALLAWSCAYTPLEPEATSFGLDFFAEAETLWSKEEERPSLPNVAGLQLLSWSAACHGKDDTALCFLRESVTMCKRLGLFGNGQPGGGDSADHWRGSPEHWHVAASYTAWGVFNSVSLHCLHYQSVEIEGPPTMPRPGNGKLGQNVQDEEASRVWSEPRIIDAYCSLWLIFHDMACRYYSDEDERPVDRATIEFAVETYRRLLAWASGLPLDLARGDQNGHAVTMMHIYFHAITTDLFRPLLAGQRRRHKLPAFATPQATPEAVFAASTNQLKRLVLISRLGSKTTSLSALGQTALLYVANAAVHEATVASPGGAEWRFYLDLCLAALTDLHGSFRLAGSVVLGLLGMALTREIVAGDKAGRVTAELREVGRHHPTIETSPPGRTPADSATRLGAPASAAATTSAVQDGASPLHSRGWVIDLELATTDKGRARVSQLIERFRELMLLQEFTTGELDT